MKKLIKFGEKGRFYFAFLAFLLVAMPIFAQSEPVISNASPSGTVASGTVKISVDTSDLARCRYNASDVSFDSMEGVMTAPDGLAHSATFNNLSSGTHTYYIRCKDYADNANSASQIITFTVGSGTQPYVPPADTANGPVPKNLFPSGTLYTNSTTLSASTDVAAECRFSQYNKAFDSMTLYMQSSDGLMHAYQYSIPSSGYYTFYVKCKDRSGNVGVAGKISFRYKPLVETPVTPADTTAPVISSGGLGPSGTVTSSLVTLTASTDEASTCKFDTTDVDYDSMASTFDPQAGNSFSKSVDLTSGGSYTYYVRCKDSAGNSNSSSAQITFTFVQESAPVISNTQPTNNTNVYMTPVGLMASTDIASECRYSMADMDFDAMQDAFTTSDSLTHQATINLENFGPYIYYVRCKSTLGAKNDSSTIINFEYKSEGDNPDGDNPPASDQPDGVCNSAQDDICDPDCPAEPDLNADADCAEDVQPEDATVTMGEKDGECNNSEDYVCDPDCPPDPDSDSDADCLKIKKGGGNLWMVFLLIGLLLLIAIAVVIIILKKRNAEEEESIETLE